MKSYADVCIERAQKATEGPWVQNGPLIVYPNGYACVGLASKYTLVNDLEFIAESRTMVPELANRLIRACEVIRKSINSWHMATDQYKDLLDLVHELESIPGKK